MAEKSLFNYEKLVRALLSQGATPDEISRQYKMPIQDVQKIAAKVESERAPEGPKPKRTRAVPVVEKAEEKAEEKADRPVTVVYKDSQKFEWNPRPKMKSDLEREESVVREVGEEAERLLASEVEDDRYVSPSIDSVRKIDPERSRLSQIGGKIGRGVASTAAYGLERHAGMVGRILGSRIRKMGGASPAPQIGLGRPREVGLGSVAGVVTAIDGVAQGVVDSVKKAEEAVSRALGQIVDATRESTEKIVGAVDGIAQQFKGRERDRRESAIEGAAERSEVTPEENGIGMNGAALAAAGAGAAAALLGSTGQAAGAIDPNQKTNPWETPVNPTSPTDEDETEIEFRADEIVFDADSIEFTQPLTSPSGQSVRGGGEGSAVGGPDGDRIPQYKSDEIGVPGPVGADGKRDETSVNRRLFGGERMYEGSHPSYVDSGKFSERDLGSYKKIGAKRRAGLGIGTQSSAMTGTGGKVISTADTTLAPHQRALLDTIAVGDPDEKGYWESPGYDKIVGKGGTFDDFSRHPGKVGYVGPKGASTAAGRYQFTQTTWRGVVEKFNKENPSNPITDFSPKNQDRVAYWLAKSDYRRRTGRELDADLQSEDPKVQDMVGQLIKTGLGGFGSNTTWEIFQRKSGEQIRAAYKKNLDRNRSFEGVSPRLLDPSSLGPDSKLARKDDSKDEAMAERFGRGRGAVLTHLGSSGTTAWRDGEEAVGAPVDAPDGDQIQSRIDGAFADIDDVVQKRIDGAFADSPGGSGGDINRMSTDQAAAPTTIAPPPVPGPTSGGQAREKSRNELEGSKDDAPPSTSLADHFQDFPGLGRAGSPGLGY